jgi:hypothetical protein
MKETEMQSFDTHKFIKEFQKASTKEAQAEVIAQTLIATRNFDLSRLATKDQLEATKQELRVEIQSSMNTVIKWNVATIIAVVGIVVAIIKFLPH